MHAVIIGLVLFIIGYYSWGLVILGGERLARLIKTNLALSVGLVVAMLVYVFGPTLAITHVILSACVIALFGLVISKMYNFYKGN
jgi:hypothetical protein